MNNEGEPINDDGYGIEVGFLDEYNMTEMTVLLVE
jgi:hypothetical protein